MRILYGLCGEGKGHATRSLVVIEHLRRRGHEVLVAASGQAYPVVRKWAALQDHTETGSTSAGGDRGRASATPSPVTRPPMAAVKMVEIVGLSMRCAAGALDLGGTVEMNAQRIPEMVARNAVAWREAVRFGPQAVVTDFDSFAWLFGAAHDLPIVSIDNAQILPRCEHESWLWSSRHAGGLRALEAFTRTKTPSAVHFIVTTFFYPHVRPECTGSTTLVPPVLRTEVLEKLHVRGLQPIAPSEAPVLVYKTASLDDASFLRALRDVPAHFLVYGCSADSPMPINCSRRPPSTEGFIDDLARSRAAVGNAGMSLLGEALAFGLPVYCVPVRGQYEQVLNACYVERLGYGAAADELTADGLRTFLRDRPRFAGAIAAAGAQHDDNARLCRTLDALFG